MTVPAYDLLSFDPGVSPTSCAGLAWWREGALVRVDGFSPKKGLSLEARIAEAYQQARAVGTPRKVACEHMQVYFGKGKGDANDLMPLATQAGMVATLAGSGGFVLVSPKDWTKGFDKTTTRSRSQLKLSQTELDIVAAHPLSKQKTRIQNIWDAVGIGLSVLGR